MFCKRNAVTHRRKQLKCHPFQSTTHGSLANETHTHPSAAAGEKAQERGKHRYRLFSKNGAEKQEQSGCAGRRYDVEKTGLFGWCLLVGIKQGRRFYGLRRYALRQLRASFRTRK